MVQNVYAIRDIVANEYGPPFVAVNDAVAIRSFKNIVPKALKDDYELRLLGFYDNSTGDIVAGIGIVEVSDAIN